MLRYDSSPVSPAATCGDILERLVVTAAVNEAAFRIEDGALDVCCVCRGHQGICGGGGRCVCVCVNQPQRQTPKDSSLIFVHASLCGASVDDGDKCQISRTAVVAVEVKHA